MLNVMHMDTDKKAPCLTLRYHLSLLIRSICFQSSYKQKQSQITVIILEVLNMDKVRGHEAVLGERQCCFNQLLSSIACSLPLVLASSSLKVFLLF